MCWVPYYAGVNQPDVTHVLTGEGKWEEIMDKLMDKHVRVQ